MPYVVQTVSGTMYASPKKTSAGRPSTRLKRTSGSEGRGAITSALVDIVACPSVVVDEQRAQGPAGRQVVERRGRLVERPPARDERVEVELALHVEVDQARDVPLRIDRAVVGAE